MSEKKEVITFEHYEATDTDINTLLADINTLAESELVDTDVLDQMRFVTFDAHYLYVCTKGDHTSNERFSVTKLNVSNASGFQCYKIRHSGVIGIRPRDYRGARAWLLCDELETTAVGARKTVNHKRFFDPELTHPDRILDVVSMAPVGPYTKIHNGRFNYLTDVVFHEAGHIEHRHVIQWETEESTRHVFPTDAQKQRFVSHIQETRLLPEWVIEELVNHIDIGSISEMYAMLIDREGAKRYDSSRYAQDNSEFESFRAHISGISPNDSLKEEVQKYLASCHNTGRLLVRVLEEQFPAFDSRKNFVRSVLRRRAISGE